MEDSKGLWDEGGPGLSVDLRTRVDGPVEPVDPAALLLDELPAAAAAAARAAGAGDGLDAAARWFDPAPLVVSCDGGTWVLAWERAPAGPGRLVGREARTGDPAADLVLTPAQLTDLVHDRVTPMAWLGGEQARAAIGHVLDWWVLIRGALDGIAPYAPRPGGSDLARSVAAGAGTGPTFGPDAPDAALREALERTGVLHVAGVFGEDEMAAVAADMDDAAAGHRPGDGRSWWARTAAGDDRLVRMLGVDAASAAVARLVADERLRRLAALTGDGHSLAAYGPHAVEALVKPLDLVRGTSDVVWHKDCSFGRHAYECCAVTLGVAVTGGDEGSGRLRALAGSHRALMWPAFVREGTDLPAVDLATRAGDVTVHLSCTLHMAEPPALRERRVLYATFGLPPRPAAPSPPGGPPAPAARPVTDR